MELISTEIKQPNKMPQWWSTIKGIEMPLMLLGHEGRILGMNDVALKQLGYDLQDVKYKSILDVTHHEDCVMEVKGYMDIFYGEKKTSKSKKRFILEDDSYLPVVQYTFSVPGDEDPTYQYALIAFVADTSSSDFVEILSSIYVETERLKGLTEMVDLEEFGSSYNKKVISDIRGGIEGIEQVVKKAEQL